MAAAIGAAFTLRATRSFPLAPAQARALA